MTDQVGVRHAELVTHAGHVEAIGDRISTAASAGASVRAGNDAYGKCVMVPGCSPSGWPRRSTPQSAFDVSIRGDPGAHR
jgi:hypothetical protein